MVTHIVRVKTPRSLPLENFEGGSHGTYREGVQLAIRRVQRRYNHLPFTRDVSYLRRSTFASGSYVIDVGVPLRYIATNICALFCGGMKSPLTMACTMKTPMMGNNTNFATQTEMIAAIGRREIGRGIFILAKEAPRRTRVSGMVMAPMKAAVGGRISFLR